MLKWKPRTFAIIYLLNIIIFTFIYLCFFSEDFSIKKLDFIKALYFSVVSITTLGYGDIIPKLESNYLLGVIIFQVTIGIITIGLFLNSLSQKLSDIKDNEIRKKEEEKQKVLLKKQLLMLKPYVEKHLKTLATMYESTATISKENVHKYPHELFSSEYYDRISIIDSFKAKTIHVDGIQQKVLWAEYINTEFNNFKSDIDNFVLKFSVLLPINIIELLNDIKNELFLDSFKNDIEMYNMYKDTGIDGFPDLGLTLQHSESSFQLPDEEMSIKNYHIKLLKLITIIDESTDDKISTFIREDKSKSIHFGSAIGKLMAPKEN